MRKAHFTVRNREVQEHAAGLLQRHLGLSDFSLKCTAQVVPVSYTHLTLPTIYSV